MVSPDASVSVLLRRTATPLRGLVGILAGVVALTWALTANVHATDRYGVGHGQGAWMALGQALLDGTLYPPLHEDGYVGGTRWMPLPIALEAAVTWLVDNLLLAQRLGAVLVAIPLYGVTYSILRGFGVARLLALGLLAAVLASPTGFAASLSFGADQPALLLQLAAVLVVERSASRRWTCVAGVLCALALVTKLSAVWAVVAIALVLAIRERRRLFAFIGAYVCVSAALLLVFELASDGRFTDNVVELGGSGFLGLRALVVDAPGRVAWLGQHFNGAVWILVPLALLELGRAVVARRFDAYHLGFLVALAILVFVLADVGAEFNHTIDLAFLTVILAGRISVAETFDVVALAAVAFGLASLVVTPLGGSFTAGEALRSLARGETSSDFPAHPVDGVVRDDQTLLAEDPGIPLSLGRRPVVLDPFMVARLETERPEIVRSLVGRIDGQEFDALILTRKLSLDRYWYTEVHFGPAVSLAICRAYEPTETAGTQVVYTPRRRLLPSASLSSCFVQ